MECYLARKGSCSQLISINYPETAGAHLIKKKEKHERQILILCLKRQFCRKNKMTKKQKGCRQMDSLSENLLKPSQANLHRQQWGVFYDLWKDIITVTSNCIIMGLSNIYTFPAFYLIHEVAKQLFHVMRMKPIWVLS